MSAWSWGSDGNGGHDRRNSARIWKERRTITKNRKNIRWQSSVKGDRERGEKEGEIESESEREI